MRCLCALLQHATAARALRLSCSASGRAGGAHMRMFLVYLRVDLLRYVCMIVRRTF